MDVQTCKTNRVVFRFGNHSAIVVAETEEEVFYIAMQDSGLEVACMGNLKFVSEFSRVHDYLPAKAAQHYLDHAARAGASKLACRLLESIVNSTQSTFLKEEIMAQTISKEKASAAAEAAVEGATKGKEKAAPKGKAAAKAPAKKAAAAKAPDKKAAKEKGEGAVGKPCPYAGMGISVLVKPAESGLREGSVRLCALAHVAKFKSVDAVLGTTFTVDGTEYPVNTHRLAGMEERGHIKFTK